MKMGIFQLQRGLHDNMRVLTALADTVTIGYAHLRHTHFLILHMALCANSVSLAPPCIWVSLPLDVVCVFVSRQVAV